MLPAPRTLSSPEDDPSASSVLATTPTDAELLRLRSLERPAIEALIDRLIDRGVMPATPRRIRRFLAHTWKSEATIAWRAATSSAAGLVVTMPPVQPIADAYRAVLGTLNGAVERHQAHMDDVAEAKRPGIPAPKPVLMSITTAVGKTRAATEVLAKGCVPATYLTVGTDLRDDAVHQCTEMGGQAVAWHGRCADSDSPGYCPAIAIVAKLGAANRMPGVVSCPTCPHGMATMRDRALAAGDQGHVDRLDATAAKLRYDSLENYERCSYICQAEKAMAADILVADYRSWAPSFIARDRVPRLHILDEDMDLITSLRATPDDVGRWLGGTDAEIVERLAKRAAELAAGAKVLKESAVTADEIDAAKRARTDARTVAKRVDALKKARPHLQRLHAELVLFGDDRELGSHAPTPTLAREIEALAEIEVTVQDHAAPWEHAKVEHTTGAVWASLRALDSLRWAKERTLRVQVIEHKGQCVAQLVWQAPTPLGQAITAREVHAVMMDATPAPATRELVEHLGGIVRDIVVEQNLDLTRWRGAFRGRGRRTSAGEKKRVDAAARQMGEMRDRMKKATKRDDIAVISHKIRIAAYAEQQGIDLDAHPELGWWGRHERGQNEMTSMGLLADGWQMPPEYALAEAWAEHRALLILAGADPTSISWWPDAPGGLRDPAAWAGDRHIAVGPGQIELCPIALPTDPSMRSWLIDLCTRDIVQAIGRPRAARATTPIPVWSVGGIPPELWRWGIKVNAIRALGDLGCHRGRASQAFDAEDRIAQGLDWLIEQGIEPTFRQIGEATRRLTGVRPSDSTLAQTRRRYPGASWLEILQILQGRIAASPGRTPLDRATDAWRRMMAEGEPTSEVERAVLDLLSEVVEQAGREAGIQLPSRAGP